MVHLMRLAFEGVALLALRLALKVSAIAVAPGRADGGCGTPRLRSRLVNPEILAG